ncbi:ionic transporter [Corticibacterium sp. UT-5YL-CI-8]|nr:ionic transporter [Tianweitania sp. UT-5YL-CI-8]
MTSREGQWSTRANFALPATAFVLAVGLRLAGLRLDSFSVPVEIVLSVAVVALVFATVFAVVAHAEAIAHRVGEPYGTLVLTLAVTAIEASVIVSVMMHGANKNPTLARESVFSTVMIVSCGIVGICLTLGGWRHRHQDLKRQGTNAFLGVLIALAVLTLVLPNFTLDSTVYGNFTPLQLTFVGTLSLLLYASFVFAQMTRHRDDFIEDLPHARHAVGEAHRGSMVLSSLLLLLGLVGIVFLTEMVAAGIEEALHEYEIIQTDAIVGAFIATLVLLPEAMSAIKAARGNELQRSLNIALGSACATIGLTIPVVGAASLILGNDLTLGLGAGDTVLLLLALSISTVSFSTGRTTVLTGLVHLVVFFAFLFLIAFP